MKWGGHCSRGGRGEGGGRPRQRSAIFPASETRRVASEGSVPRGRMHGPNRKPPRQMSAEPSKWCCAPCRAVPCRALPGVFTPPFRHALCCGKLTSSAHYRGGSSQELIDPDALLLRAPMGPGQDPPTCVQNTCWAREQNGDLRLPFQPWIMFFVVEISSCVVRTRT